MTAASVRRTAPTAYRLHSARERATRTVLVADPDEGAASVLRDVCQDSGLALADCQDGASAVYLAGQIAPVAIVLSAQLPVLPVPDVITAIRRFANTPIALGIASGEAQCAAASVTAGASAVLSRPYQRRELQPLIAQLTGGVGRTEDEPILTFGSLELDGPAYQVRAAGKPLSLTVREFQVLRVLMQHSNRVVSPDHLRQEVWGGCTGSGNTIAVHVRRLRARLGAEGDIVNVRGVGYRLALRSETSANPVEEGAPRHWPGTPPLPGPGSSLGAPAS